MGEVVSLDSHPRAVIDECLGGAKACVSLADRPDLLRQTKRPGISDPFAYVLKAQGLLLRVYGLRAFMTEEQGLLLAFIEKTVERLCEEEDRRMSLHVAKVIDLRTRRELST
jgi:hypothetical protein